MRKLTPRLIAGRWMLASTLVLSFAAAAGAAQAAPDPETAAELHRIEAQLAQQNDRLAAQDQRIAQQAGLIASQQRQLDTLRVERDAMLNEIRAGRAGAAPAGGAPPIITLAQAQPPSAAGPAGGPVGEAPPPGEIREKVREVAALPENIGVLTPRGHLILEPSAEYVRSSANRLVFRGVEIVPGIQLGVIEASTAGRDTGVFTLAARYGVTSRLEVEARAPFVFREDRITTLQQRDQAISRRIELDGQDIGDVEVAARYQLTTGVNGGPIFLATSRVKPPTGLGPFDVKYDQFGVAGELATGSGFWALEGGVTALYPTDPVVLFGTLTYLHNFPKHINKTIGGALVGEVDPGDSIGVSMGFGLALNPRFSASFGYSHNYIIATKTELGGTRQKSQPLQVGSLLMGASYRLTERLTTSVNFEFGVTTDSPDMRVVFRFPYRF